MKSLKPVFLILITLAYFQRASSIDIPRRVWVAQDAGIIVEPERLILHYDQVYYHTIGVHFGLVDSVSNYKTPGGDPCLLGPMKEDIIGNLTQEIDDFFMTLPSHFSSLTDHRCKGTAIDCILGNSLNETTVQKGRDKRFVTAALALIAGLTAVGTGIYHSISEHEIKAHLLEIDEHMDKTSEWLNKFSKAQKQYNKLSERVYTKTFHSILNNEKLILQSFCQMREANFLKNLYLELTSLLDLYKNEFRNAMSGDVSDFLVSYQHLKNTLLVLPVFQGTAYILDPGLFYVASNSFLTQIDVENRVAYFLITTPILKNQDISPLYRVENLGWWEGEVQVRFSVPKFFYYLTDQNTARVTAPDLTQCSMRMGTYLCHLRESKIDEHSLCLQDIIHENSGNNCSHRVIRSKMTCRYTQLKSGIAIMGCDSIKKIGHFRSVTELHEVKLDPSKTSFFPYTDFEQLVVHGVVISTRPSGSHIINKRLSIPNDLQIDTLSHLIIPGIEQDLEEVRLEQEKAFETPGNLVKSLAHTTSNYLWAVAFLGLFLSIINIGITLHRSYTKPCSSPPISRRRPLIDYTRATPNLHI